MRVRDAVTRLLRSLPVLLPLLAGLIASPPGPGPDSPMADAADFVRSVELGLDGRPRQPERPWLERGPLMIGCIGGIAAGALSLVVAPAGGWAIYSSWASGVGAAGMRSGLGCYYGGLGSTAFSIGRTLVQEVDDAWRSLAGRPPRDAFTPRLDAGRQDAGV
ncbi:exported hypothetical protein [uncultured Gammaproteobacteria bacterium]